MKEKKKRDENILNADWLIHEIARRAGFTVSDVRVIWRTFEDIFREVIEEEKVLYIIGLFKLYVKHTKGHFGPAKGYTPVSGKPYQAEWKDESIKVLMKPSPKLSRNAFFMEVEETEEEKE